MLKHVLAATAAATLAAPAMAGGLAAPAAEPVVAAPVVVPVAQPSADWSGFYAGLQAGRADFDAEHTVVTWHGKLEGPYYGLHVGYMHDFGRFVVGGELRYDDASKVVSTSTTYPVADGDSMISARLRLGYDLGRVLPYVAVGGAQLTTDPSWGEKDTGIIYGAGVDFAVSDHWMVGADITHYQFNDFAGSGYDISGNGFGMRVSYRF